MKIQKTNAMRILDKQKIKYSSHTYEHTEGDNLGVSIATKLNEPLEQVFKTLVAQGHSKNYYVFVIPVACELDLKKSAKAVKEKSVELIPVKEINKVTGYIRGGCSPIGMKKQYLTVINSSANDIENIIVSGGKIGFQVELKVSDLIKVSNAILADITK